MWRFTLYRRQLVSSRAAGGPAPALNRCARPPRHRVFRPVLPACFTPTSERISTAFRTSHRSLPRGAGPPKLGAKCAQFVDVALAPWRRRTEDDPFSSLRQGRRATPVRGPMDPPGWQGGSQHGQTTCPFDGRATRSCSCHGSCRRKVITSLEPTCLRVAGKVVSRPPAV